MKIQEFLPAAETIRSSDDHWEMTVHEEAAADPDSDYGETDSWDIRYLLFLQDFRNSIKDAWTPFMEFVSTFATRYLILAVLFIYWTVNKRNGLYAIASMCLTLGINRLVKLTACVYRPWIRDPRIVPAGDSITTATGYSFPSGHTATAAPQFGAMAAVSDRKHRWAAVICVMGILLWAAGGLIFVLLNNNIGKPQDNMLGSHWGHFARRMITILYYTALYPLIIKLVMNRVRPSSEPDTGKTE